MAMYNIAYLFTISVAAQTKLWVLDASHKILLLESWNKKIKHDLGACHGAILCYSKQILFGA
jgi:hypothetical protein